MKTKIMKPEEVVYVVVSVDFFYRQVLPYDVDLLASEFDPSFFTSPNCWTTHICRLHEATTISSSTSLKFGRIPLLFLFFPCFFPRPMEPSTHVFENPPTPGFHPSA